MIGVIRQLAGKDCFISGIMLTAWFILAAFGSQVFYAVFLVPDSSMQEEVIYEGTSTDYRYQEKFEGTLRHYKEFGSLYREEESTAIPGLEYTGFGDTYSRQMVPQGICIAGDYMLVSAYDNGADGKTEPSVIYVLSNTDGRREFLTTLVLPDVNHVGGIAFDGRYVWIAKSTTGYVSGIPYEVIRMAAEAGRDCYVVEQYAEQLYVGVTASFVTYDRDRLWVGTYAAAKNAGQLSCYCLVQGEEGIMAVKEYELRIPSYAQGAAFVSSGGTDYMVLTSSKGRYWDSKIYLYKIHDLANSIALYRTGEYRFPPMAEELVSDGTHMYFLFESAATCYSTDRYRKCIYPVDRICGVDSQEFLLGKLDGR